VVKITDYFRKIMKGKFKFKENNTNKLPVHFVDYPFHAVHVKYDDVTSILVSYETDMKALSAYSRIV